MFKLTIPGALLIYLILATGLAASLWILKEMPAKAYAIVIYDHRGQVKERFAGNGPGEDAQPVYYKDRDASFVVYVGNRQVVFPKSDWYKIEIEK